MWAETNWAELDTAGLQVVLVGLEPSLAMVGAREWVNLPSDVLVVEFPPLAAG